MECCQKLDLNLRLEKILTEEKNFFKKTNQSNLNASRTRSSHEIKTTFTEEIWF